MGDPVAARKHLFLVGLPGAGKSTVGRIVADTLGCAFVDFDDVIRREQKLEIADIFAQHGEKHFRALELELTKRVVADPPGVASPGGGWISREEVLAVAGTGTALIWLQVSPTAAVRRMGADSSLRPLLAGADPEHRLADLAAAREQLYARAGARINTELLSPQEVAADVVRLASSWGWSLG